MPDPYTQLPNKKPRNISEDKLKRIFEYNERLQEQLELPRIPVSEASKSLVDYCNETKDPLVPSIWGPISKKDDPFALAAGKTGKSAGCCTVM